MSRESTKKAPAKKSSAKTSPAKKAAAKAESAVKPTKRASQVATEAAAQLSDLTGHPSEAIVGLERTDDGWKVQVEVVELRRIPATTDMLASYEVEVDSSGDLVGYRRLRRYPRGSTGEGER